MTIGHTTYPVPDPFLVMATQNPIESEGTYPLPEAQVDRFMLKMLIDYPAHDEELTIVQRQLVAAAGAASRRCRSTSCGRCSARVFGVYVDPALVSYAVALATRRASPPRTASPSSPTTSPTAPARAGRSASSRPRARSRSCAAATTSLVEDIQALAQGRAPPPPRPHLPGARRGGRPRTRSSTRVLAAVPVAAARPRAARAPLEHASARSRATRRRRRGPGRGRCRTRLLRALDVTIGRRVEGLLAGDYRSTLLGDGTELAQIRPYVPGDDVRRIDWNVTARTSEPHVRVHLAERVLVTWLVLDTSPSMQFGTADRRKADVAEGVAIAVGHVATRRGNRLGVVTFGERRAERAAAAPGPGRARSACSPRCATSRSRGRPAPTSLGEALRRAGALARQRSLVVVVSDFRGPLDWRRAAAAARRAPRRASPSRSATRASRSCPNVGELWLVDPETGRQLRVDTRSARLRAALRRRRRGGAARRRPRARLRRRRATSCSRPPATGCAPLAAFLREARR